MAIKDALLAEFDREMTTMQKVLERIPEDKFGWKPHEKSGSMIWMAAHLANLSGWATMTLQTDELDLMPEGKPMQPPPAPTTRQELLDAFEKNRNESRAAIAAASDADFGGDWSLLKNRQKIFTMPRVAVLRGMVMNHMIHHRGQLTMYLRLNDVPVPAVYGPSADETAF